MKLISLVFLSGFAVSVLANETVPMTPQQEQQCRKEGGVTPADCCDYNDCPGCGFYERCCYKSSQQPTSRGACECGVDDYPQGTCF